VTGMLGSVAERDQGTRWGAAAGLGWGKMGADCWVFSVFCFLRDCAAAVRGRVSIAGRMCEASGKELDAPTLLRWTLRACSVLACRATSVKEQRDPGKQELTLATRCGSRQGREGRLKGDQWRVLLALLRDLWCGLSMSRFSCHCMIHCVECGVSRLQCELY
jgi:hypothetical protein